MATTATTNAHSKVKITRKGVHAKTKSSKLKNSKNYRKAYKGQG
tara:strand:+ start:913 stop:1044 length:132 start_codon:yes stop_codon:yes gene_type:complete